MTNPLPEPIRTRRADSPRFEVLAEETGVGGWLLFFCISESAAVLVNIRALAQIPQVFRPESWALGEQASLYRPLVLFETAAQVILTVGGLVGLILLFRRHPRTPRFFTVLLAFSALYGVVEMVGAEKLYAQLLPVMSKVGTTALDRLRLRNFRSDTMFRGFQMLVVGIGWALYWQMSARVARTFGDPELAESRVRGV